MRVTITLEIADEFADSDHETGVTNDGFERIFGALSAVGDDIQVKRTTSMEGNESD